MGLSLNQALNTASMGLQAAESSINVIGNNLANANTVGFKSNRADFADMFSRTYTYGSYPAEYNGGTNPVQIGLGVTLTGVTTNFTQGTVKGGMTSTDMAIQGDGFFVVQPNPNNPSLRYYTRNGVMKLTANQDLVTTDGMYVMGYSVNSKFQIQTDKITSLRIPVGEMKIAEATENVVLDGLLNATGSEATQGTVLNSEQLTDLSKSSPGTESLSTSQVPKPGVETAGTSGTGVAGTGSVAEGDYLYRFVFVDANGVESDYSAPISATVASGENSIQLTGLPAGTTPYTQLRIYRADKPEDPTASGDFYKVTDLNLSTNPITYTDIASSASIQESGPMLDQSRLSGTYSYYVTYVDANGNESRPSVLSDSLTVSGGQILLSDIPVPDPNPDGWTARNIYRATASEPDSFYKVTTINNLDAGASYIDKVSDAKLTSDPIAHPPLSMAGRGNVLANENTKMIDVGKYTEDGRLVPAFELGTLSFTPSKGGSNLKTQTLEITESTKMSDYLKFLNESFGLRPSGGVELIPTDQGEIGQYVNGGSPGATMIAGSVAILGNSGTKNELEIDSSSFKMNKTPIDLGFTEVQEANGESTTMSMQVFDSLGAPVDVKMTMVLQEKTDTETIYRWYADSNDNQPPTGNAIGLGTGLLRFDSNGGFIDATNATVTVERTDEASQSPMSFTFDMDMSAVAALSTTKPEMTMQSQDGAGAGILEKYTIAEDGIIYGTFSSNVTRPIGQVLLATFANNEGLLKQGDNLYREGVASGQAIIEAPGSGTAGIIKGNSIELSNTDIGQDLIDMILASTMYQANAKIVTTTNTMMDALLRAVS